MNTYDLLTYEDTRTRQLRAKSHTGHGRALRNRPRARDAADRAGSGPDADARDRRNYPYRYL